MIVIKSWFNQFREHGVLHTFASDKMYYLSALAWGLYEVDHSDLAQYLVQSFDNGKCTDLGTVGEFTLHSFWTCREVIARVESKKFGANSDVVIEYLEALTFTDHVYRFCPSGMVWWYLHVHFQHLCWWFSALSSNWITFTPSKCTCVDSPRSRLPILTKRVMVHPKLVCWKVSWKWLLKHWLDSATCRKEWHQFPVIYMNWPI